MLNWRIIDINGDINGGMLVFVCSSMVNGSSRSHHRATKDLQGDQPRDWEPQPRLVFIRSLREQKFNAIHVVNL